MTFETRLRRSLEAQRDAVPPKADALSDILSRGRRRLRWRQGAVAFTGAAALVTAVIATPLVLNNPMAVAASPITGNELTITHEAPTVLQARLGPAPEETPHGVDRTFETVDEPTAADLEAIDEVIAQEQYDSPIVVSLGAIESVQTRVYVIHDVDPETRSGRSTVVAIGPDFPSFVSRSGPTEQATWPFSATRGPDGSGWMAIGVPDFASYFRVEVNGTTTWQRPADGFIWLPFTAGPDDEVVVTGHDATGRVYLRHTVPPPPSEMIEEARAAVEDIEARIVAVEAAIAAGDGDTEELEALQEALRDAVTRLEAIKARVAGP